MPPKPTRAPTRVIGKDDLIEAVWRDSIVEESNLTFNIRQLRVILGDDTAGVGEQRSRHGREEHERREAGRADRVALGHGLGRVAHRVQGIGDVAHAGRGRR